MGIPKMSDAMYTFHQREKLGKVFMSDEEEELLFSFLAPHFKGIHYNVVRYNCNSFSQAFIDLVNKNAQFAEKFRRLNPQSTRLPPLADVPPWVCRLQKIGESVGL